MLLPFFQNELFHSFQKEAGVKPLGMFVNKGIIPADALRLLNGGHQILHRLLVEEYAAGGGIASGTVAYYRFQCTAPTVGNDRRATALGFNGGNPEIFLPGEQQCPRVLQVVNHFCLGQWW